MTDFQTRAQWGAKPPKASPTPWKPGQPTGITIHWEGAGGSSNHSRCDDEVRSIQAYHQNGEYSDIAYSALCCQHGTVYDGRGVAVQSAANNGGNSTHLSICYIGGSTTPFTDAAKQAINWWIATQAPPVARQTVIGHRDEPSCSTACPGDTIEAWIRAGRPSSVKPTPAPVPPPPSVYGPWPYRQNKPTLSLSSRGDAVSYAQKVMRNEAGQQLAVDGVFGPATANAVKNVQKVFSLAADGVVGPKTWAALDHLATARKKS